MILPALTSATGAVGALCIFFALCLVALCLIFFFVPETAGRSLEDQDFIFGVKTGRHARHQRDALQWYLHRPSRRGEKPSLFKTDDSVPTFDSGGDDVSVGSNEVRPRRSPIVDVAPDDVGRRDSVPDDVSVATEEDRRAPGRRVRPTSDGIEHNVQGVRNADRAREEMGGRRSPVA